MKYPTVLGGGGQSVKWVEFEGLEYVLLDYTYIGEYSFLEFFFVSSFFFFNGAPLTSFQTVLTMLELNAELCSLFLCTAAEVAA